MKHHTVIKSFLFLALLLALSTPSFASEVTGNLSSGGGNGSGQQNTGSRSSGSGGSVAGSGTSGNGTLSGNVSGTNQPSGQIPGGGNGEVLGASTMNSTTPSAYRSDALSPDGGEQAIAQTDVSESVTPVMDEESFGTASVGGAISEFSPANWFWIIVLIVLLVAAITYIYNHERRRMGGTKLHS